MEFLGTRYRSYSEMHEGPILTVWINGNLKEFLYTFVYAKCSCMECRRLWSVLMDANIHSRLWVVTGDFNIIRNDNEEGGGGSVKTCIGYGRI